MTALVFTTSWAGAGQFFLTFLGVGGVFGVYRLIQCHVTGCVRLGRFPYGHYRYCRPHHPDVPSYGRLDAPPKTSRG
jgi:hypothetical protein